MGRDSENFEIGRFLHLKSEIRNFRSDSVQFEISDFGFEMQDSSNFEILPDPSRGAGDFGLVFSAPRSRKEFTLRDGGGGS
jgi:hypothetical protein